MSFYYKISQIYFLFYFDERGDSVAGVVLGMTHHSLFDSLFCWPPDSPKISVRHRHCTSCLLKFCIYLLDNERSERLYKKSVHFNNQFIFDTNLGHNTFSILFYLSFYMETWDGNTLQLIWKVSFAWFMTCLDFFRSRSAWFFEKSFWSLIFAKLFSSQAS